MEYVACVRSFRTLCFTTLAVMVVICHVLMVGCTSTGNGHPSGRLDPSAGAQLSPVVLPAVFEANKGQRRADVRFLHRAAWGTAEFRDDSITLRGGGGNAKPRSAPQDARPDPMLERPNPERLSPEEVSLRLVSDARPRPQGGKPLKATATVVQGSRATWRDVPLFDSIEYPNAWPGAALAFGGPSGALEFHIQLDAGADLASVKLDVTGASRAAVAQNGDLELDATSGRVVLGAPRFLALAAGKPPRPLRGRYQVSGMRVGFECERRQPDESLLIDPRLGFAVIYGGADFGFHRAFVATVSNDTAFVCQVPYSSSPAGAPFPADALVQKIRVFNPAQAQLLSFTALESVATIIGIDTDAAGRLYLGGITDADTLPAVGTPFQAGPGASLSMAVLSLDPSGDIDRASYVGEPAPPAGRDIGFVARSMAVSTNAAGETVVGLCGQLLISGPSDPAARDYRGPGGVSLSPAGSTRSGCIAILSDSLSQLNALNFAGDGGDFVKVAAADQGFVVAATKGGIIGHIAAPTTPGAFQSLMGTGFSIGAPVTPQHHQDLYIVRYDGSAAVVWATLLGGPANEFLPAIAVAPSGEVVVKANFAGTPGVFGPLSGAVFKLSADGTQLVYAAMLPWGPLSDGCLRVLPNGAPVGAFFLDDTQSGPVTTSPGAFDSDFGGCCEIVYSLVGPDGNLSFTTLLGGHNLDEPTDMDIAPDGASWITGITSSSDFPVTVGTAQHAPINLFFLARITNFSPPLSLTKTASPEPSFVGHPITYTIRARNTSPAPVPAGSIEDLLPLGFNWNSGGTAVVTPDGTRVTFDLPPLPAFGQAIRTLTAIPTAAGTFVNHAKWIAAGEDRGSALAISTVLQHPPEISVSIETSEDFPDLRQTFHGRVRVRNSGLGGASSVTAKIHGAPKMVGILSVQTPGLTQIGQDLYSWPIGALPAGAEVTANFVLKAGDDAGAATIGADVTTPTLQGQTLSATKDIFLLGTLASVSLSADPPVTLPSGLIRRDINVTVQQQSGPIGTVGVDVQFNSTAPPAAVASAVTLSTPGPVQPMTPSLQSPGVWVMSIRLYPDLGLPSRVSIVAPDGMISGIRATVTVPAVTNQSSSASILVP